MSPDSPDKLKVEPKVLCGDCGHQVESKQEVVVGLCAGCQVLRTRFPRPLSLSR